jgi:hypothetical protein
MQIPCRRKKQILFRKKKIPLWYYQKVLWDWYHHNAGVYTGQNVSYVWWTCFVNKQSAFLWVSTMAPFSPTCSFIGTRQTSYKGFSIKSYKKLSWSINFTFRDIDDVLSLNNSDLVILLSHQSNWAWSKWYHRYR